MTDAPANPLACGLQLPTHRLKPVAYSQSAWLALLAVLTQLGPVTRHDMADALVSRLHQLQFSFANGPITPPDVLADQNAVLAAGNAYLGRMNDDGQ
jgi:hypothetical protein